MRFLFAIALAAAVIVSASASETDRLLAGLTGDNEAARSEARQMLVRQQIQVVHRLTPLVSHENRAVAAAAMRVLEDFAGEVTRPGREEDQHEVARAFVALAQPGVCDRTLDAAFRLIPLVAPEGYDLTVVAAWLRDPDHREAARASLELTGTAQARAALRGALQGSGPDFQVALLDSLAQLAHRDSLPVARALLDHQSDAVRVAAARVVARAGGLHDAAGIQTVLAETYGKHHHDAGEALSVLAERLLLAGGNWDHAIALYHALLTGFPDPVVRGLGIAGLGRHGDERSVPVIAEAVKADDGEPLIPQALAAFHALDGEGVRQAFLRIHPELPPAMQTGMLSVYAHKRDRRFVDWMLAGLDAPDAQSRQTAMLALADARFPEAADAIIAALNLDEEEQHLAQLRLLERTAAALEAQGETAAAGRAYLAVYRGTPFPGARRMALEGIKRCPVPEAYEVILSEVDTGAIDALPVDLLVGLTRALYDAGRTDEAERTLDALIGRAGHGATVDVLIAGLHDAPVKGGLRSRLGFLTEWHAVGPFPWSMDDGFTVNHVNAPDVDIEASYEDGGGERLTWKAIITPSPHGFFDLTAIFGAHDHCSVYAVTTVILAEASEGVLRVGSDDGIKVWVNGEPVLERNVDRGMALDQDNAAVSLKEGENEIVIQVTQNLAGWGFVARLTDAEGRGLTVD